MTLDLISTKGHDDKAREYSFLLEKIVDDIEVPDWLYKRAEERYKAVGEWLSRIESNILPYEPYIYVQGSFLLGTANKPINTDEGYDIDLVCCLNIPPNGIAWDELKKLVGDEIKANGKYKEMLKQEGKRCWTIAYSEKEEVQFHLDILPAIPNDHLKQDDNPFRQNPILITDNILKRFLGSNPKGYLEWFKVQMMAHKQYYDNRVRYLSEQLKCEIEAVPTNVVKTPLQIVIQLLKRHRDMLYKDESEESRKSKPISIIITTLAAKAYASITNFAGNDLYTIAKAILQEMPKHIEAKKNSAGQLVYWVENPTDKTENFADKWEQFPKRATAFFHWLENAQTTLDKAFQKEGIHNISEYLKEMFGEKTVSRALNKFHESRIENARTNGTLGILGSTSALTSINENKESTKIPKNTFYGGREIKFSNKTSAINLAIQKTNLQKYKYIKSELHQNKLVWKGIIQSTPLSEKYIVEIIYQKGKAPKVFVKNPSLLVRLGETPPHIYKEQNLCLYYPPNDEWNSGMLLAKTIIPWTALWLHYYEMWLATGEWLGGGIHPPQKRQTRKSKLKNK